MSDTRKRTLELKDEIFTLYCVNGKSLFYISERFNLPRHTMTKVIKEDLCYEPTYVKQVTSGVQKRINVNKSYIIDYCKNSTERELSALFEELGITRGELQSMRDSDKEIDMAVYNFTHKTTLKEIAESERLKRESEWAQDLKPLEDEVWRDIVGYEGIYQVSNLARIKNKVKILKHHFNKVIGRNEIRLSNNNNGKQYKVYRLVAEAFLPNLDNLPTVNHKDGDCANDVLENLEWSSYKEQNFHKNYILKRPIAKAYGKNGKFRKVIVDGKYEFKTLVAAARFLNVSETTIQRYLSGVSKCSRKIELIY